MLEIKRLKFAIKYRNWSDEWLKVNFLDEKSVQSYANGRAVVKRKVGERYEPDKMVVNEAQSNNKINLVGIVSFNGPNVIYSVSTKFNGQLFKQLVKRKVKDIVGNTTVLMDNARIHLQGINYLQNIGIRVLDFPPKNPDLNIIEDVWAMMQKNLNRKLRNVNISKKDELLKLIEESWNEIPSIFIKNCILSMPNRLEEVIKMQEKQTRY